MVLLFLLAPAFAIGNYFDSFPYGFLIVGVIYLLATGVFYFWLEIR
jgi:hypothetical protein